MDAYMHDRDSTAIVYLVLLALYHKFDSHSKRNSQKITKGCYLEACPLAGYQKGVIGRRSCTWRVANPGRHQKIEAVA